MVIVLPNRNYLVQHWLYRGSYTNMSILKNLEIVDDVLWLNYKGYEIRIEKSKSHNNNNLVITIHPDTESDYTHRLEVKNED